MRKSAWGEISALLGLLHGVASTRELLAAGISERAIGWAVRSNRLVQLRRGAYTSAELWVASDAVQRQLLKIRAEQRCRPERIASSLSAATVLGLPLPNGPPALPLLTVSRSVDHLGAVGDRGGSLQRRAWIRESDVMVCDDIRVTGPVRTVIDCARHCTAPWALAIGDAAARTWQVTGEAVAAAIKEDPPMPGHRRAGWVARHLNAAVESPLESLPRALIVSAGLPEPTPQVWISTAVGSFRVDMLDAVNGVVTEADGRLKYTRPADLWDEKRREDAIRDTGLEMVRFVMPDLSRPGHWLTSYRRAIARSAAR